MKKLIGVPTNNGQLATHFGHCKEFVLFDVTDGKVTNKESIEAPAHEPGLLPRFLADKGVTDIVAGGMGSRAIDLFKKAGINAFVGAPQVAIDELIEGYLNQTIEFSANYCDH